MDRKEFLDRFVLVRTCAGCGEILEYERCHHAFCLPCEGDWIEAKAKNCPNCLRVVTECTCMPKSLSGKGMAALRKLIFYESKHHEKPRNQIIYFIKHRPNRRVARFFAKELAPLLMAELKEQGWENRLEQVLLINIPRGKRAKVRYGFDQSELICREIAKLLGCSCEGRIRRKRGGKEQKKLGFRQRFGNIKGLFYWSGKKDLAGHCVILFDDIVTSGASMEAGLRLIKKAGADCVIGCSIAEDQ